MPPFPTMPPGAPFPFRHSLSMSIEFQDEHDDGPEGHRGDAFPEASPVVANHGVPDARALLRSPSWRIGIGSTSISPDRIIAAIFSNDLFRVITGQHASNPINAVVLEVRMPRIVIAALVGASLAVAGTAMQGIFRNPMASPYILGLSSGAAFGASLAMVLGFSVVSGEFAVPAMAFIFCFVTLFIVYGISATKMGVPVTTLLLAV